MQFSSPPPSPLIAMFEQLLPVFAILATLFVATQIFSPGRNRKRWKRSRRESGSGSIAAGARQHSRIFTLYSHEERQLFYANKVNFKTAKLVNKAEYRILRILEEECAAKNDAIRVMAQTSMGAIIRTTSGAYSSVQAQRGYDAINSKRFDFAVFNRGGDPILIVEYQGSGHSQGNYRHRDEIKRLVLAKAGVPLLEIQQGETDMDIRERIRQTINKDAVATTLAASTPIPSP